MEYFIQIFKIRSADAINIAGKSSPVDLFLRRKNTSPIFSMHFIFLYGIVQLG